MGDFRGVYGNKDLPEIRSEKKKRSLLGIGHESGYKHVGGGRGYSIVK